MDTLMHRFVSLLLALLFFTVSVTSAWATTMVPSQGKWIDHGGTVTTGGTAQTVMANNPGRYYMIFQNLSAGELWINCGVVAVQDQPSLKIAANAGTFVMEGTAVCTGFISIIGATTGQTYSAKEM